MADLTYAYLPPEGDVTRHMWTLLGPNGAVHIWAEPNDPEVVARYGEMYYGGIEVHSAKPLYDFGDGKPSHDPCWLLKCPCWHSGSSLQFSEKIAPFLREVGLPFKDNTHEYVNTVLFDWHRSWFSAEEVA